MSAERDVMRVVRSWLREDEHDSADRVLEIVLDRLDTTPQRRSWWPARRVSPMGAPIRIAIAAAAVLVVAVLGYNLLPGMSGPGGPAPTASAIASPPDTTPTPRPMAGGSLAPGAYFGNAEFSRKAFTFTVPAGWAHADNFISKGDPWDGNGVTFATWIVSHVYGDSCEWEGSLREVRSPELLATALAEQGGHATTGPTEVTVGGYPATRLEFSVATDFDVSTCDGEFLRLWPDAGPNEDYGLPIHVGQTTTVYVIDMDGLAMLVVTARKDTSTAGDVAELQALLASVQFQR
jgi:hypothetical protein